MALTTTTLAAAVAASDTSLSVASATGFAARSYVKIDNEFMQIAGSYTSGTSIPVLRGVNGTFAAAHVITANVTAGVGSDWADPSATIVAAYPLSGKRYKVVSYTASGAITLPTSGEDVFAILNGTSVLAMTVAAPGKDIDGSWLYIAGNGAAAHTVTYTGGLSGAGANYDVVTVNAGAPILLATAAVNGLWISPVTPAMTGTVTNITGGVA